MTKSHSRKLLEQRLRGKIKSLEQIIKDKNKIINELKKQIEELKNDNSRK